MNAEVEEPELSKLLNGIERRYGYDFRDYAPASLKRRVLRCVQDEQVGSISALQERLLRHPDCMARFLHTMSVSTTSMFRDPAFYRAFREKVVPQLRGVPFLRIWAAGCATGEEVYSLAILLQEEGLYDRARIYATDMTEAVIEEARAGVFPIRKMKEFTRNYQAAGGARTFSDYYSASRDNAIVTRALQANLVWAVHNLVTDNSFNEFQVISCRNVMIYFNHDLQSRVHKLFHDSLAVGGFLGLGSKESLDFTPHEKSYEPVNGNAKIYRRMK